MIFPIWCLHVLYLQPCNSASASCLINHCTCPAQYICSCLHQLSFAVVRQLELTYACLDPHVISLSSFSFSVSQPWISCMPPSIICIFCSFGLLGLLHCLDHLTLTGIAGGQLHRRMELEPAHLYRNAIGTGGSLNMATNINDHWGSGAEQGPS